MRNAENLIINLKGATLVATDTLNIIELGENKISFDDAHSLRMYCEEYIKSGGCNFGNLPKPKDKIKNILSQHEIVEFSFI